MPSKLYHHLKYLQMECKDVGKQNHEYYLQFLEDFQEEMDFLDNKNVENSQKKETAVQKKNISSAKKKKDNSLPKLKEIYKTLVKELHPDKHQTGKDEKEAILKKITQAYESDDLFRLVDIANENGINVPHVEEYEEMVYSKKIKNLKAKIKSMKGSLYWKWATEFKPFNAPKEMLYDALKINNKKFNEWKKNQ